MFVPAFRFSRSAGLWETLRSWIQGRHQVAREREGRATAQTVISDLEGEGGVWLDRDQGRLRLVIRPGRTGGIRPGLEHAEQLFTIGLQSAKLGLDPRAEQGHDPTTR